MASDGPSPHSPSLRLGLPGPQPSRRHHAQSLLGPSFHDPRTHHDPEQAAPFSRRDDERWRVKTNVFVRDVCLCVCVCICVYTYVHINMRTCNFHYLVDYKHNHNRVVLRDWCLSPPHTHAFCPFLSLSIFFSHT